MLWRILNHFRDSFKNISRDWLISHGIFQGLLSAFFPGIPSTFSPGNAFPVHFIGHSHAPFGNFIRFSQIPLGIPLKIVLLIPLGFRSAIFSSFHQDSYLEFLRRFLPGFIQGFLQGLFSELLPRLHQGLWGFFWIPLLSFFFRHYAKDFYINISRDFLLFSHNQTTRSPIRMLAVYRLKYYFKLLLHICTTEGWFLLHMKLFF